MNFFVEPQNLEFANLDGQSIDLLTLYNYQDPLYISKDFLIRFDLFTNSTESLHFDFRLIVEGASRTAKLWPEMSKRRTIVKDDNPHSLIQNGSSFEYQLKLVVNKDFVEEDTRIRVIVETRWSDCTLGARVCWRRNNFQPAAIFDEVVLSNRRTVIQNHIMRTVT